MLAPYRCQIYQFHWISGQIQCTFSSDPTHQQSATCLLKLLQFSCWEGVALLKFAVACKVRGDNRHKIEADYQDGEQYHIPVKAVYTPALHLDTLVLSCMTTKEDHRLL